MNSSRTTILWGLCASGLFLYALPTASFTYFAVVLGHAGGGLLLALLLPSALLAWKKNGGNAAGCGWAFLGGGAAIGIALLFAGTPRAMHGWLLAHIALSVAGALLLAGAWLDKRRWFGAGSGARVLRYALLLALAGGTAYGAWWTREVYWNNSNRITNPPIAPETMDQEGDGPKGPFFPSSAQTADGKLIPGQYFLQSKTCERCHQDVYDQWNSSAHHFSSFNNQWYRKSVEYMQDVDGVRPSKWCAGCHDPAMLFSGMFDKPVKETMNRPEASAGLSCMVCHSIVKVKSTMGQADFVLEYPELHKLATSENRVIRTLHDYLVRLNPEPHRRTFLKPFMVKQTPEFCASCHKVHLDVPVNNYRWVRGFNEYDNWQASGVSGEGARSFYYPASPMQCPDCHMPLVPSKDDGNIHGYVHSHRFPGANTALPTANEDAAQMEANRKFLQSGALKVDIFGVMPEAPPTRGGEAPEAEIATTFAVGEEAEQARPTVSEGGAEGETQMLTAPLGRVEGRVRRGEDARVEVVVRTKKVGHFFPGGTVDAFDVWLELEATDEKGHILFWSGRVEDEGKGPVDPGAHFYRSLQIDAHGNRINKRNAWATRSVAYVRLIPPGAADTVHYRLRIPENAGERITLHAKLNYRKFAWGWTQFAYAGVRDPKDRNPQVTKDYDDGKWVFTGDTSNASGKLKQIPDLPVIMLAEDTKTLQVLPGKSPAPKPHVELAKEDWERWNDYGIGLFLEGDLRAAGAVFEKLTKIDPQNADGWVNVGRVRVQEGDIPQAYAALGKALELKPELARANYFYARALKSEGRFEEAKTRLHSVLKQYPRDRVVRNELGRILFLQKRYQEAVAEFQQVLEVDPEDLQANYNLMLCYNGLGDEKRANEYKARYLRFKADEAAQAITGPYRRKHPEDNNERQAVHEHENAKAGTR